MQRLGPGVGNQETAGPVSALGHAVLEAGLPDQRRLLVAGHAEHRYRSPEQAGLAGPEFCRAVPNLWQQGARYAKDLQQLLIPVLGEDIEKQRARSITRIACVHATTRQAPEQKTVDGAESEFASLCPPPCPGDIVENPGNLGGRKIGIKLESGLAADELFDTFFLERRARGCRAPVLPDDRVMNTFAAVPIPDQRGFPLIRDADARDGRRAHSGSVDSLLHDRRYGCPYSLGIVLYPTGLRINLREFLLRTARNVSAFVINDGPAAAGALIYGQQVRRRHGAPPSSAKSGFAIRMRRPASVG